MQNSLQKYKSVVIYILMIIILLDLSFAQNSSDSTDSKINKTKRFYEIGAKYFDNQEYNKAAQNLQQGIYILEPEFSGLSDKNKYRLLRFYKLTAASFRMLTDFTNAEHYYKKGLKLAEDLFSDKTDIVSIYIGMGRLYFNTSAFEKSESYFRKAYEKLKTFNNFENKDSFHAYFSRMYNGFGRLYYRQSLYDLAGKYYKKSLDRELNSPKLDRVYTALMYNNLGNVAHQKGDLDKALELYNRSLQIKEEHSKDFTSIIRTRCNIANVYSDKEENEKALEILKRSQRELLNTPKPDKVMIAWNFYNMGNVLKSMHRLDEAVKSYRKALKFYREIYGKQHYMIIKGLLKLGECFAIDRQYSKALRKYFESLDISRELFGEVHADVAQAYYKIGKVFEDKGENYKALRNYRTASKALRYKFLDYSNENIIDARLYLKMLATKADLLTKIYRKSGMTEMLFLAFRNYQSAFRLVDKMQISYKNDGSKFVLAQKVSPMYGKAIEIVLELYQKTGNSEFENFAFQFAEKNKANTLLQKLYLSDASSFARIPKELIEKEDSLKLRLTILDTELKLIKGKKKLVYKTRLKEVETNYYALKESLEDLRKMFEKKYPQYYELKYKNKVIQIDDVQKKLDGKTALIEYSLTEKNIVLFVFTDDNFKAVKLPISENLSDEITSLLEGITNRNFIEYSSTAYSLYKLVFQPIEKYLTGKDNLIIIPDDEISNIPFEALLTEPSKQNNSHNYHQLEYLIKSYNVTYHLNASLLFSSFSKKDEITKYDYIAFVPQFDKKTDDKTLATLTNVENRNRDSLPFSLEEVIQIRDKFSSSYGFTKKIKTLFNSNYIKIFAGKEATEENFKKFDFADYRYLHFATHCIIDKDIPELSGLILEKGKGKDDGILYLNEIYNFKIRADLVTLSACETAQGKWVHGEGMIGFTRGFLYAGAKNILASFWKVNDYSTSRFMKEFYSGMINGMKKSKSLRKTKLEMINSGYDYAMPYYWASFKLIGNSV
ncbi:MAG: CHAT domain-containing protein [Rhodothermaceae bacterium]